MASFSTGKLAPPKFSSSSVGQSPAPKFTAVMPASEPGWLSILSTDPPIALKLPLGPVAANPEGGVGGWTGVDRPQRKAATEWSGTPLESMTVQVILDGLATGTSVEPTIKTITALGTPGGVSMGKIPVGVEPPVLKLGGMVPHGNKRWVLNAVEWDQEDTIWVGLQRVRQFANLTFLEYDPTTPIKVKRPSGTTKLKSRTRTVRARKGDTLASLVKRELKPKSGSALKTAVSKAKSLNNIRDSKKVLKTNQAVKLPASGGK